MINALDHSRIDLINNTITQDPVETNLDLDNIFHANHVDIGAVDPQLSDMFMTAINPLLSNNNNFNQQIQQLITTSNELGYIPQDEILALERQSGLLSERTTIASKMVNLGVKFINELTHLQ